MAVRCGVAALGIVMAFLDVDIANLRRRGKTGRYNGRLRGEGGGGG